MLERSPVFKLFLDRKNWIIACSLGPIFVLCNFVVRSFCAVCRDQRRPSNVGRGTVALRLGGIFVNAIVR